VHTDVLLLDDHSLLAQALACTLRAHGHTVHVPDVTVTSDEALLDAASQAGTVVLDLDLGEGPAGRRDGVTLIPALCARGVAVVVSTASADLARWGQCLAAGAETVIHKSGALEELTAVIDTVSAGCPPPAPPWRHAALRAWQRRRAATEEILTPLRRLTPRENEVLQALADGVPAQKIAASNVVSEATVRAQIRSILCKLGVGSQLQAAALLHRAKAADLVPSGRPTDDLEIPRPRRVPA
jgi:DNA-binding NarL/FixJ family response regulator